MQATKVSGLLASIVRQNVAARSLVRRKCGTPVNTNVDCKPPPPPPPPKCGGGEKLYELRIYQMKPECYRESIDLMAKYWPVRTAYSKAIGSWMSELGGICETVHLWEYDSLSDRMEKRQKIAKDEKWTKEFWPAFFEKSHYMNTYLLAKSPGSTINTEFADDCPSKPGVFELHQCEPYSPTVKSSCGEAVVGQFYTVYGPTPAEFIMLRYSDVDKAYEKAADRRKSAQGVKGYSRFLVPCGWSNLK